MARRGQAETLEVREVLIRPARPDDASALASFARRIFDATFGPFNDPADMRAYTDEAFGDAQQGSELVDPAIATLLAEADGELAGYAQVSARRTPPAAAGPRPIELMRFYVGTGWQGRGVAQALMRAVVEEASRRGGGTLWLCVWGENARALAFYRKWGFREFGTTPFQLGRDIQTDLVMARALQ
jgi:ribosomal protein S18 acetylase RimI-like enzyme